MLVLGKKKSSFGDVGGAIILSEQFLSYLDNYNIKYEHVDLNFKNNYGKVIAFFRINFFIAWKGLRNKKIILNASKNGVLLHLIPLLFLNFFPSKKIVLRFFGSNFKTYLQSLPKPIQYLIKFLLAQADLIFFEEKYQVKNLQSLNNNIQWFPNMRLIPDTIKNDDLFEGKFVYLGHIREEKGINILLEAKLRLGNAFDIKLFGPKINYTCPAHLEKVFNQIYMGAIAHDEVVPTLSKYDVLILPSFSEGYPGVIIEAFSVGLPIIASDLPGIREMVEGYKAAKLIPIKDVDALINAVLEFNKSIYLDYRENSLNAFNQFDAKKQMPRILDLINSL